METLQKVPIPERLTWAEICARYPKEWVVLADLEMVDEDDDCDFEFRSAVVLDHSTDRDGCLRRTRHLRPLGSLSAHLFTGPFERRVPDLEMVVSSSEKVARSSEPEADVRKTPASARLTWAQICIDFPSQWVFLVDIDWVDQDCDFEFRSAVVLDHSPDRDGCLRRTRHLADVDATFAHLFTGPVKGARPLDL